MKLGSGNEAQGDWTHNAYELSLGWPTRQKIPTHAVRRNLSCYSPLLRFLNLSRDFTLFPRLLVKILDAVTFLNISIYRNSQFLLISPKPYLSIISIFYYHLMITNESIFLWRLNLKKKKSRECNKINWHQDHRKW